MRTIVLWLCVLGAGTAAPAAGPATAPSRPRNVILMGWDGCHRNHVNALLKQDRLPNLKKLIAEGTLVDIDVTSGATDTKAGWTQILTGSKPEVTGVYNNGRFRDVPAGYSVFERLKTHFGTDKFAALAVIGKKAHCGEIAPPSWRPVAQAQPAGGARAGRTGPKGGNQGRVVEANGAKFMVFEGSPYFTMHKACDEWHFGLSQDTKVGDKALGLLDKYKDKPFFFFVHLAEVDHSGHRFGEPSKEYDSAIVSGDTQLGRVVEKLKALGLYDSTRIYVTADHGFDVGAKKHSYAPHVFLATNDKGVVRGGTRADITPTVLDRLGVDLSKPEPKLDGQSLLRTAAGQVEKAPASRPAQRGRARPARARAGGST